MTQLHTGAGVPPPPPPQYPPQQQHPAPPLTPHLRPPRQRTEAVTLALACLAVVLAAVALAVALLRPTRPTPAPAAAPPTAAAPTYTNEQVTAAKTKACKAAKTINDRLLIETNWPRAAEPLESAQRAALGTDYLAAAVWLPTQVDAATPSDLRAAIVAFATGSGNALVSADREQLDSAHAEMATSYEQIERSCA